MNTAIEDFGTGWYGIKISMSDANIDELISYLQELKRDQNYHFHLFSTKFDSQSGGIADIEFMRLQEGVPSNSGIGG